MHIHILGICGTFMGGVAALAREAGHHVTGSDRQAWPPMSIQLEALGIEIMAEDDPEQLASGPDAVIVGNVMTRGRPIIEALLDSDIPYCSGPDWLSRNILSDRWVLAVAGTHGKTTTSSLLAWLLEDAGLEPGFLIGGVPSDFACSARLGKSPFFVVEADEYDSAFFDKRAKFVHYRPRTLILNNLEFDHADIYPDLAAIETQFHHLVRTVPGSGLIIANRSDTSLARVLERGCWTPVEGFFGDGIWNADFDPVTHEFKMELAGVPAGACKLPMTGDHNVANALAAVAAARHAGVPVDRAMASLARFGGVKRRLELKGEAAGVLVYDDFAHHPTAIEATLKGLRASQGDRRLLAVLEPRSNTMRMGLHRDELAESLSAADRIWLFRPDDLDWDLETCMSPLESRSMLSSDVDAIADNVAAFASPGDIVVVMSNGAFGGIHQKILTAVSNRAGATKTP